MNSEALNKIRNIFQSACSLCCKELCVYLQGLMFDVFREIKKNVLSRHTSFNIIKKVSWCSKIYLCASMILTLLTIFKILTKFTQQTCVHGRSLYLYEMCIILFHGPRRCSPDCENHHLLPDDVLYDDVLSYRLGFRIISKNNGWSISVADYCILELLSLFRRLKRCFCFLLR